MFFSFPEMVIDPVAARTPRKAFTLVEIMIVVAIIGLLAAIALPSFLRARERSLASTILNELRMTDGAKDQYAMDNGKMYHTTPAWDDLTPYLKAGSRLANNGGNDSLGNPININGVRMRVSVSSLTKSALSDATDAAFWGPFF